MALSVGFDTSNYTTSAAWCRENEGRNESRLLDVPDGALGLRQSDALFLHTRHLPEILERVLDGNDVRDASVIAASSCPREVEGSYMPCFLAGVCAARTIAAALGAEYMEFSHQQGHLAAAAWSAGREDLLDKPFLAWHLSGGTTELLHVVPDGASVHAKVIGSTTDISAGQLIDRTGRLLHLPFPSGIALDELSRRCEGDDFFRVKVKGLSFSLSGVENQIKARTEAGERAESIAYYALSTVTDVICRVTDVARKHYPGLSVLCVGGVSSNAMLRQRLGEAVYAAPEFSRDNAMGIAVLARRFAKRRERDAGRA